MEDKDFFKLAMMATINQEKDPEKWEELCKKNHDKIKKIHEKMYPNPNSNIKGKIRQCLK